MYNYQTRPSLSLSIIIYIVADALVITSICAKRSLGHGRWMPAHIDCRKSIGEQAGDRQIDRWIEEKD